MCVIIHFQPGQMLPTDLLETAISNNWHGYGLIVKLPKKLEVIKKVPEDYDNPDVTRGLFKEIHDLLKKYSKYERVIHLRHKTEGDITEDNCHPFEVYNQDGREVQFAHNGTLYEYRPSPNVNTYQGVNQVPRDPRSDSRIFAEKILKPLFDLSKDGDYTDIMFRMIINKFWGSNSNTGILVCNNLPTFAFPPQEWKDISVKDTDNNNTIIKASNDLYFKELKRGPIFEEAKKKKEDEQDSFRKSVGNNNNSNNHHNWPLSQLRNIDFRHTKLLNEELVDVMDHINLYTDDGLCDLSNLLPEEINALADDKPEILAALFSHVIDRFAVLFKEKEKAEEKHILASKMVAELKKGSTLQ